MKKNKLILTLLQIVLISTIVTAENRNDFSAKFHSQFDLWLNGDMTSTILLEEMNVLERALLNKPTSWETTYWRARVTLVRGQIFFEEGKEELSISELEKSQRLSMESINIQDNSDSWRLMADAGSYIMLQKGMGYIMANSSKVQDQAKMALELDPTNTRASLIIAQYLVNAPGIAGGNKNKGIEILQNISQRNDLNDEDTFYIFMALSEALNKKRRTDDAIRACRMALSYFPGNRYSQDFLTELQSK